MHDAMEDVFDKMRHEELSVSSELIDALFAGLDTLKAMKDEVANGGASMLDTTRQTARLRAVLQGREASPSGKEADDQSSSAPAEVQSPVLRAMNKSRRSETSEPTFGRASRRTVPTKPPGDC